MIECEVVIERETYGALVLLPFCLVLSVYCLHLLIKRLPNNVVCKKCCVKSA